MCPMSSRASGGALAASLITAAIVGFSGGAYFGTQADDDPPPDDTSEVADPTDGGTDATTPSEDEPDDEAAESGLTLTADQTAVAPNEQIDLSGSISPAEGGVEVQVQRSIDDGEWEDFPANWTTNDDGTFSGYIYSQREGVNSIRVVRGDDDSVVSEPVQVTIG